MMSTLVRPVEDPRPGRRPSGTSRRRRGPIYQRKDGRWTAAYHVLEPGGGESGRYVYGRSPEEVETSWSRSAGKSGPELGRSSRNHFASRNGTAPIDASSGDQHSNRLSRLGIGTSTGRCISWRSSQLRHDTEGREYFRRKLAAGKTPMEAMRCLKRRLSDVVYRQMVADAKVSPGGHSGATQTSSADDPTPTVDCSDKPQPGLTDERTPATRLVETDPPPPLTQAPKRPPTRTAKPARSAALTSMFGTTSTCPEKRSSSKA